MMVRTLNLKPALMPSLLGVMIVDRRDRDGEALAIDGDVYITEVGI